MSTILIFHQIPEPHRLAIEKICPEHEVIICSKRRSLYDHLPEAEVLMTFKLDQDMLQNAPRLKWVQSFSTGVDNLPLAQLRQKSIILTSTRGIHRIQMAEYGIAAMINLARNCPQMFHNQVNRRWDRNVTQNEIYGAWLGILGLGDIGREIARKAKLFGMHVLGVKRQPEPVVDVEAVYDLSQIQKIFQKCDYIINLLPRTADTVGVINKSCFNLMKPDAAFINMGRGTTVNQDDLIQALQAQKIKGMVSDVFAKEPLPPESPLWSMSNVIITPHIAGNSKFYEDKAMLIIRHNLKAYVQKDREMLNVFDYSRGY